MDENDTAAA